VARGLASRQPVLRRAGIVVRFVRAVQLTARIGLTMIASVCAMAMLPGVVTVRSAAATETGGLRGAPGAVVVEPECSDGILPA
jgi:hypothetical protein